MNISQCQIIQKSLVPLLGFDYDKSQKGFTLLELMVVMIIVSVLSAIAIPTFFSQIGKARESELLIKLGAMARSQQGYHFEKGVFAPTMSVLKLSDGDISSFYYNFIEPEVDVAKVKHQAVAKDSAKDQTRNYAIGVYFENGAYDRATCQGSQVGDPVNVGDTPDDPCTPNGNKIR